MIQWKTLLTGEPHVDHTEIAAFLKTISFPLHLMDFETFATAIPLFDNTAPYMQVPFQFSLHVVADLAAPPTHVAFLAEGKEDPRPAFLKRLKESLGDHGSVLVFNQSFEIGRLRECAAYFPEYAEWVNGVAARIIDLLAPFRSFHYYHPRQHGSASIKAVLPALTGKSYADLAIAEGGTASREFLRMTFTDVTDDERRRVRRALEEYCGLDTQGMLDVVRALWSKLGNRTA